MYNDLWYPNCVLEEVKICFQYLELSISLKIHSAQQFSRLAVGPQKTHLELDFEFFCMQSITNVEEVNNLK